MPLVNTTAVALGHRLIETRTCLQRDLPFAWRINLEPVVEDDAALDELVLGPEVAARERRLYHGGERHLQDLARAEPRHGDVLFTRICVDGRLPLDRRAQILHRIGRCGDDRAVRLEDAHEHDVHPFVRGAVGEGELPPRLHARFALYLDAQVRVATTGSV